MDESVMFHRENTDRFVIEDAQKDRVYYTIYYKNGEHET
jgi:hypothetical protein